MTSNMIRAFIGSKATVVQIDTTYRLGKGLNKMQKISKNIFFPYYPALLTTWVLNFTYFWTLLLEKSGYKLNALLYRNPVSGKGQVALLSFIADETAKSYEFALGSFDYLRNNNPPVIIIDKVTNV